MTRLLVLLGAEGGGAWLVQRLAMAQLTPVLGGGVDLGQVTTGELLVVAVHAAALLGAWWLVLGTAYDVAAALHARRRGWAVAGRGVAPRWVQRIVQQAVGSALVLTVMSGPAMAQAAAPTPAATATADLPTNLEGVATPGDPARPGQPPVRPPQVPPASDAVGPSDQRPVAPQTPSEAGSTHTIAPGENLWVIARGVVTSQDGPGPSDRTVHEYWVRLIAANREALRSGDPDLVFPGEVLQLPPLVVEGAGG